MEWLFAEPSRAVSGMQDIIGIAHMHKEDGLSFILLTMKWIYFVWERDGSLNDTG